MKNRIVVFLSAVILLLSVLACTGSEITPFPTYDLHAKSTEMALTLWAPWTQTAAAKPTNTPSPTDTPSPTSDPYYSEMLKRLDAYQAAYTQFAAINQEVSDNPYIIKDDAWKLKASNVFAKLQVASEDFQTIPNVHAPYENLNQILISLGTETLSMVKNYTTAIDKVDASYLGKIKDNLLKMNEYMRQATDELVKLK
jgi:hypothetical protein